MTVRRVDQRERFRSLLADLELVKDELFSLGPDHPLHLRMRAFVDRRAKGIGKKPPKLHREALVGCFGDRAGELIYRRYSDMGTKIADGIRAREKAIEAELTRIAPRVRLVAAEEPRRYCLSLASTWSTQPASRRYAMVRAELHVADLKASGVVAEQREYEPRCFEVLAWVEEKLDIEVLRRLPGEGLPELVRLCWSLGANPRVYWPFLPHGFEAEHGFDFYGRPT